MAKIKASKKTVETWLGFIILAIVATTAWYLMQAYAPKADGRSGAGSYGGGTTGGSAGSQMGGSPAQLCENKANATEIEKQLKGTNKVAYCIRENVLTYGGPEFKEDDYTTSSIYASVSIPSANVPCMNPTNPNRYGVPLTAVHLTPPTTNTALQYSMVTVPFVENNTMCYLFPDQTVTKTPKSPTGKKFQYQCEQDKKNGMYEVKILSDHKEKAVFINGSGLNCDFEKEI